MRAKTCYLLVLILISTVSISQTKNDIDLKFTPNFCAIIVRNIDSAIGWYQRTFHVSLNRKMEFEGIKVAIMEDKNRSWTMELLQFPSMLSVAELTKGKPEDIKVAGYFKFGFSVSNFDAFVNNLEEQKAVFIVKVMKDQATGKRNFIIADMDGNNLQFFEE
jgi:uncharacterized glyoxalase superfamily protein PhnB